MGAIGLYVVLLVVVVMLAHWWHIRQRIRHLYHMARWHDLRAIPTVARTQAETAELRRLDAYVQFYGLEKAADDATNNTPPRV